MRKHEISEKFPWAARLALVFGGSILATAGYYGYSHGNLWFVAYDVRTNSFGIAPTLGAVTGGIFFIILGLIPWERLK